MTGISDQLEILLRHLLLQQLREKAIPSISVMLVDGNETIWECHLGSISSEDQVTPDARTIYSAGSITKTLIAILTMQQVEAGKLDLDTPVQQYVPAFRNDDPVKRQMTIRHILQHASGLPREVPGASYFRAGRQTDVDIVEALNDAALVFTPGEGSSYCNSGFALLGKVLETVTNQSLGNLVQGNIFNKAGMTTASLGRSRVKGDIAGAVMNPAPGVFLPAPPLDPGPAPTGGMFASPGDLAAYMRTLLANDGALLSPESVETMWQGDGPFGLSFFIRQTGAYKSVGHGGTYYGYASEMELIPERNLGAIVFTTHDIGNTLARRLVVHILETAIALQDKTVPPDFMDTKPIDLETSRKLSGVYSGHGQTILIRNTVPASIEMAGCRGELRKLSDGSLAMDTAKMFMPGLLPADDFSTLTFHGIRLDKTSVRPPLDEASNPRCGSYGLEPGCPVIIFEREGELYAELIGLFVSKLEHNDGEAYRFSKASLMFAGESLEFVMDGDKATAILLNGEPLPRMVE